MPKAKSKKVAAPPEKKRWDVVIWELATRKVSAVIGENLPETGSFHTVGKRVEMGYTRINDAYSIAKVPPGTYQLGSILSPEHAKPA